jgi:hypothetical protein
MLLRRHPELTGDAAEERLAMLAELADQQEDREAAAMYRFHQALIRRSREVGAEEAVAGLRAAAELVPELVEDGTAAYSRFGTASAQADLDVAVAAFERAALLAGSWHPERSVVLNNLGRQAACNGSRPRSPPETRVTASASPSSLSSGSISRGHSQDVTAHTRLPVRSPGRADRSW